MSFVVALPEVFGTATTDLADIGSSLNTVNAASTSRTTTVITAAEDEVSTAIAALFCGHGQAFQALSAQASAFHAQFVQALNSAGNAYASGEAANSSWLQAVVREAQSLTVFSPVEALTGRPLVGNGANGTTVNGLGTAGGAGGWIYGNGGNGGNSTNLDLSRG